MEYHAVVADGPAVGLVGEPHALQVWERLYRGRNCRRFGRRGRVAKVSGHLLLLLLLLLGVERRLSGEIHGGTWIAVTIHGAIGAGEGLAEWCRDGRAQFAGGFHGRLGWIGWRLGGELWDARALFPMEAAVVGVDDQAAIADRPYVVI